MTLLGSRSLAAADPPTDLPALRRGLARSLAPDAQGVVLLPRDGRSHVVRLPHAPGTYRMRLEDAHGPFTVEAPGAAALPDAIATCPEAARG